MNLALSGRLHYTEALAGAAARRLKEMRRKTPSWLKNVWLAAGIGLVVLLAVISLFIAGL